ncbi:MAG TPA: DUF5709 domain-containing protein [Streptosporangiaceae bacterium]|jgi:hypothetical protein
MPDETRHESADLEDYEVLDASDTLDAPLGSDPLDRGVAPPERWTAGIRYGTTESEQERGESLDQLLAEEEPDVGADLEDEDLDDEQLRRLVRRSAGEDLAQEDLDGLLLDDGPDPRAGRLVAEDEGVHAAAEPDLVARDTGIDGGAATAEEAAMHVVDDDDTDVRSE